MPATPLSSNIERWDYDASRRILTVIFRNGATYEYEGVPQDVIDEGEEAPSAGVWLAERVKGRFRYRRVA
jgi:frataxin-like iron-binding protein CyaY